MDLTGLPMIKYPHPSHQHAGLHHAVWWPQQEVTRPKTRFKPTSSKKSGVDGREQIRCQHIAVSCFTCNPHGDLVSNHCICVTIVCVYCRHKQRRSSVADIRLRISSEEKFSKETKTLTRRGHTDGTNRPAQWPLCCSWRSSFKLII